jgi:hypothetical protein
MIDTLLSIILMANEKLSRSGPEGSDRLERLVYTRHGRELMG